MNLRKSDWTPVQRRIVCEQAFFANTGTGSGDQQGRTIPSASLDMWVQSKEGWPLWLDWLDCCRAVARARGYAPRGLDRNPPRSHGKSA